MTNRNINSVNVYKYTDKPNEAIFKETINILSSNTLEYNFDYITALKNKYNICLSYIVKHLVTFLIEDEEVTDNKLSNIIIKLGILEKNISNNGDDLIQICGLISYFHELKC